MLRLFILGQITSLVVFQHFFSHKFMAFDFQNPVILEIKGSQLFWPNSREYQDGFWVQFLGPPHPEQLGGVA